MGANEKVDATFHGGDECCSCFVTPESEWLYASSCGYGSGIEPGSMFEFNPDCPVHGRPDEITADVYRFEARSLQDALIRVLDALPDCTQCGQPFRARACGPTHAVVAEDPASHRIFKEAKG